MKKQFLLLGVFCVQSALADYRFELTTDVEQFESDSSRDRVLSITPPIVSNLNIYSDEDGEADVFSVGGKIYFTSVSTSDVPLREAGFLSQSSSAYFIVGKNKEETKVNGYSIFEGIVDDETYSNYKTKGYDFETGVELITPGIPFVLQLGVLYATGDRSSGFSDGFVSFSEKIEEETLGYSAGFGIYYTDAGQILYRYSKETSELDYESLSDSDESDTVTHILGAKHIFRFSREISLKLQATWEKETFEFDDSASEYEDNTYGIGVAFYPLSSLEISAGLASGEVELSDENYDISHQSLELGLHYFFTENFAAGLSYVISEADYKDASVANFVFGSIQDTVDYQSDDRSINFDLNFRF